MEGPRKPLSTIILKALFTSRVFKRIGGDYSVSQNFPDRLFTRPGLKGTILDILTNLLHTSIFLARLKTLHDDRAFLEKSI
jgi:hypothetical protein